MGGMFPTPYSPPALAGWSSFVLFKPLIRRCQMSKLSDAELQRNWSHRYRRCVHCYNFVDTWKPHHIGVSYGVVSYLHNSCVNLCPSLRSVEPVEPEVDRQPIYRCETCGNHTTTPYRKTKFGCYCSKECHNDAQQSWIEYTTDASYRKEA